MIFNVLIGDLLVINGIIDLGQPGIMIARYVKAPRAYTQREMNSLYSPKADIYVAFRLQLVTKFAVICLIYSSAMPGAYLFAAAFMWMSAWVDRFNLLRRFSPPPRSPDNLIGLVRSPPPSTRAPDALHHTAPRASLWPQVLTLILPLAIIAHMLCAVMFYGWELSVVLADPLCDSADAAAACTAGAARGTTPHCQTEDTRRSLSGFASLAGTSSEEGLQGIEP